jgi:hypothetical protein
VKAETAIRTRLLRGFDDPSFGRERWNALVRSSPTPSPYLCWELQRAFDEVLGAGERIFVLAERGDEPLALAAVRNEDGYVAFNGTCFEFDRLDFVGDVSEADVLEALIATVRECASGFWTFDLEFVHSDSPTHDRLPRVAKRLELRCEQKYESVALELDFRADAKRAQTATSRQILKDERWLARNGRLEVRHLRDAEDILGRLPTLFDQHRRRWPGPHNPSRFHQEEVCRLFERITELCIDTELLRFTEIDWDGRPIACHYGMELAGRRFMKAFSMESELAGRSPGGILMRHVILGALEEGAEVFDFGTGEQDFKRRYATRSWAVPGWSLTPAGEDGE